ncbi:MAG TPA: hypothetical protein VGP50_04110, partial [Stellaceae bacterium]|nr:hypothetical protein [Stellaceae bacterium]
MKKKRFTTEAVNLSLCARAHLEQVESTLPTIVIPAKAGTQGPPARRSPWVPAFAGTTAKERFHTNRMRSST